MLTQMYVVMWRNQATNELIYTYAIRFNANAEVTLLVHSPITAITA